MSEFENMNNQQQNEASAPTPVYVQQAPVYNQPVSQEDTTPISTWGYVGYMILFCIPCVGLICLLVFAFGGSKNVNLRNFSRAQLIIYLISIVLAIVMVIIMMVVMGSAISAMGDPYSYMYY